MLTKADFQRAIRETIDNYPDLAIRYRASDPIILQHLEAIATMLAMVSQSIDVARSEVFEKSRDATVMADAAMRGIVPKARPARVEILVTNKSANGGRIEAGRLLQDSRGRPWVVLAGADIPGEGTAAIRAEQRTRVSTVHTVERDEPFHAVEIKTALADGQKLAALSVADDQGEWTFADRYTNVGPGDRVYHVEADDRQRVYVRFGMRDVVGVQPAVGTSLTLRADYTHGDVTPALGSPFAFESVQTPVDAFLSLSMQAMASSGQDPITLDAMRVLARYPSVYDANAVYLGEFDFLVRRHYPDLRFLSVWNERLEERARGASVDNINTLFIACQGADAVEPVRVADEATTQGTQIPESQWTELQRAIRDTIARADDSYRVRFITPLQVPQVWRIEALIGSAYLPDVVAQRLREAILSRYGIDSMRQGGAAIPIQEVYAHLRRSVPEIAEPGADINVILPDPTGESVPEIWRFVTSDTLTVTVSAASVTPPAWGW